MTMRAADVSKERFALLGGGESLEVARNDAAWNIHCRLKDRCGGDVANGQFVGDSIFVEIICRNDVSLVVFLTNAETLDRLHAVMLVVSVDGEDANRVDDAFLMKGLDHQVRIHAFDLGSVNGSVGTRGELTEENAFRAQ